MSPEEYSKRPPHGRSPHERRPASIDGVSPSPMRRPITPQPGGQRPVYDGRPVMPTRPQPMPARPPMPPPASAVAPQQLTPQSVQHAPPLPVPQKPTQTPTTPQFTPPPAKKSWKRLVFKILAVLIVLALLTAGIVTWLNWRSHQNDPDMAFHEALTNSLSITQVQADTDSPEEKSQVVKDYSKSEEPQVSNDATVRLAGSDFDVKAYGSRKNTYISYKKVPDNISPALQVSIKNSWVKLRADGRLPTGINPSLVNAADPRYQAFGPLIFGNFPLQMRTQLVSFMEANKIYKYDRTKVIKKSVGDTDMFVFPVTLNVNYLKIANQSAAASEKFPPSEVQALVDALDQLKGAKVNLYVTVKDHRFQKFEAATEKGTTTITYSRYNQPGLPVEPQTKLTWYDFASVQSQLEAQAAAGQAKSLTKTRN